MRGIEGVSANRDIRNPRKEYTLLGYLNSSFPVRAAIEAGSDKEAIARMKHSYPTLTAVRVLSCVYYSTDMPEAMTVRDQTERTQHERFPAEEQAQRGPGDRKTRRNTL
ncbi:hypothetical protein ES708_06138 [subsurface metagenome]